MNFKEQQRLRVGKLYCNSSWLTEEVLKVGCQWVPLFKVLYRKIAKWVLHGSKQWLTNKTVSIAC